MAWSDAPCHNTPKRGMCGGCSRAFPSTGGGLGSFPRNIFQIRALNRAFRDNFKDHREKKAKKGFSQKLGKKGFCFQKGVFGAAFYWVLLCRSLTYTINTFIYKPSVLCWWPDTSNCFEPIHMILVYDIFNISTLLCRGTLVESLLCSVKGDKTW